MYFTAKLSNTSKILNRSSVTLCFLEFFYLFPGRFDIILSQGKIFVPLKP